MRKSIAKAALTAIFAFAFCFAAACGSAAPEGSSAPSPKETEGALVFAVVKPNKWITDAVEEYNSSSPGRPIELLRFNYLRELADAVEAGLEPDMYFAALEGGMYPKSGETLWDISADLSEYLTSPLAGNLRSAMTVEGELRFVPFDFRVDGLCWRLGGELPQGMDEAALAALEAGARVFPGVWSRDALASYWLYPYVCAADGAAREELLGAIYSHTEDGVEGQNLAFGFFSLDSGDNFSLGALLNGGAGFAPGVPGSATAGSYVPEHVIGICSGCADPGAAWDFLSIFLGGDMQALAYGLPATASGFEARLEAAAERPSTLPRAVELAREIVEGTGQFDSYSLAGRAAGWYVEYINSPERLESNGLSA